jgi:hypothetical protein
MSHSRPVPAFCRVERGAPMTVRMTLDYSILHIEDSEIISYWRIENNSSYGKHVFVNILVNVISVHVKILPQPPFPFVADFNQCNIQDERCDARHFTCKVLDTSEFLLVALKM